MAQPAPRSSLIFIVPALLVAAGGLAFYKSRQPPTEELDNLISDVTNEDSAKLAQWVKVGIKYDEFNCINNQYQPVFYAASQGNDQALKLFLDNGAKPDSTDKRLQHTALMAAAGNTDVVAVQALLAKKANPNAVAKDGLTALVAGIASARETVHETDKLKAGEDAKRDIASKPARRVEIVKALLAAGADPNLGKKEGAGPAFQAFDDPSIVKMLIEKGVKLTSEDDNGKNLLFVAQDKDLAEKILAVGVNPNKHMKDGRTPLMWGLDAPTAEVLIAHGADVNATDDRGQTALHHLAEADGDIMPKVKVLLAHGAKWDLPDKRGITPYAAALDLKKTELSDLLKSKGVQPPTVFTSKKRGGGGGGGL